MAALKVALWLAVCSAAEAHIHSQKIRHIERDRVTMNTWACALVSSALVGACGVFPLILNRWIRLDGQCGEGPLRAVLSFAAGGLLGDVFLHLLPEAWGMQEHEHSMSIGLWVLTGLLSFMVVEKAVKCTELKLEERAMKDQAVHTHTKEAICNGITHNGTTRRNGITYGNESAPSLKENGQPPNRGSDEPRTKWLDKDISGYLNLLANCTDNFTHGLAIAASYVANPAVGALTTLAILCHEIPHEIGDFAILLKSGFSLRGAARLQMVTATGGLVGVIAGLTAEHMSNAACWLLPFTAGGFLYIALVSIVPDLLKDSSSVRDCVTEVTAMIVGIVIMALVTIVEKKSCSHMPP